MLGTSTVRKAMMRVQGSTWVLLRGYEKALLDADFVACFVTSSQARRYWDIEQRLDHHRCLLRGRSWCCELIFGSIGTIQPAQCLGFVLQRLTVTAHENLNTWSPEATFADHQSVSDNVHDCRPSIHNSTGAQVGTACRMNGEPWAGDFSDRWYDFVAVGRRAVYEIPEYPATILALQMEWVGGVARQSWYCRNWWGRVACLEPGEGSCCSRVVLWSTSRLIATIWCSFCWLLVYYSCFLPVLLRHPPRLPNPTSA